MPPVEKGGRQREGIQRKEREAEEEEKEEGEGEEKEEGGGLGGQGRQMKGRSQEAGEMRRRHAGAQE